MTEEEKKAVLFEELKKLIIRQVAEEGKSAAFIDNIINGEKFKAYKEVCDSMIAAKTVEEFNAHKTEFMALKEEIVKLKAKSNVNKVKKRYVSPDYISKYGINDLIKKGAIAKLKTQKQGLGMLEIKLQSTDPKTGKRVGIKLDDPMSDTVSMVPVATGASPFHITMYRPGLPNVTDTTRKPIFLDLVDTFVTNAESIVWSEMTNIDPGIAYMIAEGASAESNPNAYGSFRYTDYLMNLQELTLQTKATERILDDVGAMQRLISDVMEKFAKLKLDNQIFNGNGTPPNLNGIINFAQPAANNSNLKVQAPNLYDCLIAAITQIQTNGTRLGIAASGEVAFLFEPSVICLNPGDVAAMLLTKDTLNNYVYDRFPEMKGLVKMIDECQIVSNIVIPQGSFLVMDAKKSHVALRQDLLIQMGYVNDDFSRRQVTFRAVQRAGHYIMGIEEKAFVYDTFANMASLIQAV